MGLIFYAKRHGHEFAGVTMWLCIPLAVGDGCLTNVLIGVVGPVCVK